MIRRFCILLACCTSGVPTLAAPATAPAAKQTGWIWSIPAALQDAPVETRYFRYEFNLTKLPAKAELLIGCDNSFQLYVNGVEAAAGADWQAPVRQDIAAALVTGANAIAIQASNGGGPAWLYVEGTIQDDDRTVEIKTGNRWQWSAEPTDGWMRAGFKPSKYIGKWQEASVLGDGRPAGHIQALLEKAVTLPAIPKPIDWTAWRERQRRGLTATSRPADPPGEASRHPVDRFMIAWWAENKIDPPHLCDDATFLRRAYLDLIGLPPSETELNSFLEDKASGKRQRLIDQLRADDLAYAEGWMAWWCDLLRNDEQTNIDNLRKPITKWLFDALQHNKPYDQMIAELLNPGPGGPDGYLKGINWRGIVNASQRPPVQAAQNVGQVFLATSIKCASCHDHFTKPLLLEDSYGLASFFSEKNLEIYRCDKPTGRIAAPEFLLHDAKLAKIPPDADLPTRLKAISEMVTSVHDPRFAPAMVNRLWKKLMGRGLFEPVDDYTAKCANKPLLDRLAYDFMAHNYDLKYMIRLLMTSRAYQLQAITESTDDMRKSDKTSPVFVGPPLRRLHSEQVLDGISSITGSWPKPAKTMNVAVPNDNIRAWRYQVPGPLAIALGRPNREQVCTARVEDASMLQMLEMTNGKVLAERLTEGAKTLLASPLGKQPGESALEILYLRSLARPPRTEERELLAPMLGSPTDTAEQRAPGWEDVCWMIVMSPDFQYIN